MFSKELVEAIFLQVKIRQFTRYLHKRQQCFKKNEQIFNHLHCFYNSFTKQKLHRIFIDFVSQF